MKLRTTVCVALVTLLPMACGAQEPVPPDKYVTPYLSVTPPTAGGGWRQVSQSKTDVTYGRGDKNGSFVAMVKLFRMPPAASPAEYEKLIRDLTAKDVDPQRPDRYGMLEQTVEYSAERAYPCVRYHAVSLDKAARGASEPQVLEMDGLYCRHPKDETLGAAILYSHRGAERAPGFGEEAEVFVRNSALNDSE